MKQIIRITQTMIMSFTVIVLNSSLSSFVMNDAWMKLLIIVGCLKWWDIPHLHHPLILIKIQIDDIFDRKAEEETDDG